MSSRITLNTNIAGAKSLTGLDRATQKIEGNFERLSSGLRINKAVDDASGLAVASLLEADSKVYAQGVKNISDGISMLTIADGALTELSNIVVRLNELATQSATGTISNTQRNALDKEAQALSQEYGRILRSTEFNGRNLFNGDSDDLTLLAGYGDDSQIGASVGGAVGDGTFNIIATNSYGTFPHNIVAADFNNDGDLDVASNTSSNGPFRVKLGNGDGTFGATINEAHPAFALWQIDAADFNGDGFQDIVSGSDPANSAFVAFGNGDGTFQSGFTAGSGGAYVEAADVDGDGDQDIIAGENGTVFVSLNNGNGSFATSISTDVGSATGDLALEDLNDDGILDLVTSQGDNANSITVSFGNGDGTFQSYTNYGSGNNVHQSAIYDYDGDGDLDIASTGYSSASLNIHLNNGDGTFANDVAYGGITNGITLDVGDFNSDGFADLVLGGSAGDAIVRLGNGDGTFDESLSLDVALRFAITEDFNKDGVSDVVGTNGTNVVSMLSNTVDGSAGILPFSIRKKEDALKALNEFDSHLARLSLQRGEVGASLSRLSTVTETLKVSSGNFSDARSRIRDVDVAQESSSLIRAQILQQAATAVSVNSRSTFEIARELVS